MSKRIKYELLSVEQSKSFVYKTGYSLNTQGNLTYCQDTISGTPAMIPSAAQTVLTQSSGTLTRYYMGNYEEEIRNDNRTHTFDTWGNRRNPTNWTQQDTRTAFIFNRGYTMHEHLPEFKLINMNGRVYDPLTAQFFSPDPYLQAPGNWLNYNRYAYALNNPFKYTDPDGEFVHLIIGAVIGGVVNWAFNGCRFDAKGLGYFGVGALAGALGAGISSMLPVAGTASGGFAAGFLGTSAATTATSSFVSGALIGGGAGLASGFTSGLGNGLLSGQNFGQALWSGTKDGLIGGLSGAAIGGLWGGIDAVRDGRRFWDGATVTKDFYADVNVVSVKQIGDNNCLPASGESVNKSLGGDITQSDLRGWAGGNPNLDPLGDASFWQETYAGNTGNTVQGYNQMGAKHIVPTLNDGGRVALSIPGSGDIGHSVVVKSVYMQTVTKINGNTTQTIMYRIMDPGTGGFRNIPLSKINNIFTIRP